MALDGRSLAWPALIADLHRVRRVVGWDGAQAQQCTLSCTPATWDMAPIEFADVPGFCMHFASTSTLACCRGLLHVLGRKRCRRRAGADRARLRAPLGCRCWRLRAASQRIYAEKRRIGAPGALRGLLAASLKGSLLVVREGGGQGPGRRLSPMCRHLHLFSGRWHRVALGSWAAAGNRGGAAAAWGLLAALCQLCREV